MRTRPTSLALTATLLLSAATALGQARTSTLVMSGAALPPADADTAGRDMERKQELIAKVLRSREEASGRTLGPALRGALARKMLDVSTDALEGFLGAGGLGNVEALAQAASGRDVQALGDTGSDLVFTPVTPCRIINTLLGGGTLVAGSNRSFLVAGAAGFGAQGGNASGCGVPDDATAAMLNFIAVNPQGPGDLRAYPYNPSPSVPNASVINYAAVPGLNIANGVVQPICNAATTTCTYDLIVQADVSGADLVVDVLGYYRRVETARVKSFSVYKAAAGSVAAPACANYGSLYVTITAPVAGSVVANAAVDVALTHVTGGSGTELDLFWEIDSATTCTNYTTFAYLPPAQPSGYYYQVIPTTKRFTVAAGSTTTFYVNSKAYVDAGEILGVSSYSSITATFTPD